ncbi:hypothetical protein [Corynebacterium glutamicum]|uniref:hypothetical protein n=1 Tax=Corynebacterium glutamicum TaxID=1718 RepID=UPI000945D54B|nr:hypothetical protein [Corynebacterium glutamicum]OKX86059.1 hypothetical protein AUO96_09490 [Corynebacterium glutamicum]QDX74604.1 hypothetical protein AKL15_01950 [Corynebacterium glutamicum]QDX77366.1 hypothetical protein AKL16_01955 [Corynebacterium glutamicum]TWS34508.1 hypothetical protein AKJ19_08400 [Corynebacterium glutamicum]TWS38062.1 hypothetical protein AKJ20_00395 [Corynebacterium glutamicum]
MQNITRKIAALAIAGTLILPATTGIAHAQSNFSAGSSSFDFGSSGPEEPQVEPLEVRLEVAYERLIAANGHVLHADQELEATGLLNRAFAGEFEFVDGKFYVYDEEKVTEYWIDLLTKEQAEEILDNIEADIKWAEENPEDSDKEFGLEVGKLGDYYYIAGVETYV